LPNRKVNYETRFALNGKLMEKGLAEVSEDNPTEPRNDQEVADPFLEN
jgi:hypothetical protein